MYNDTDFVRVCKKHLGDLVHGLSILALKILSAINDNFPSQPNHMVFNLHTVVSNCLKMLLMF